MTEAVIDLEIFADYFQFYVEDSVSPGVDGDTWNEEATQRMAATAEGVVAVGTARNMTVPVRIEIADAEPSDAIDAWDHVVDASLNVPSGTVVIVGCTDYRPDAKRISVAPGCYRVRIFASGLDALSEDGLDGDDRYRVVLWPGEPCPLRVLRQWTGRDVGR